MNTELFNFNIFLKLAAYNIRMLVWKYNDACCLNINDEQVSEYAVEVSKTDGEIEVISFTKDMPYIMDLRFNRYEFEKNEEIIKGSFVKPYIIIKLLYTHIYIYI